MIEKNTKLYKILFIIGCVVLAIAFSFGLKTMIDYKNNEYSEAGKYGEISEEGGGVTTSCATGSYQETDGTCSTCPKGFKCDGKTQTACSGTNQYQDETGQGVCKTCNGTVNADHTSCTPAPTTTDDYKITLSPSSVTLKVGETKKISASTSGTMDGTVASSSWTSSNDSVATVGNDAVITAKGVGTATITAQITSSTGKKYSATVSVKVDSATTDDYKITLSPTSVTLKVGETKKISASTSGTMDGTVASSSWTSSNDSVATVGNDAVITAKSAGTATITAQITSSTGKKYSATVSVTVSGYSSGNYCESGSYLSSMTSSGQPVCYPCPAGNYCPDNSDVQEQCPSGSYCPAGAKTPTTCPDGKLSIKGSDSEEDCYAKEDASQCSVTASVTSKNVSISSSGVLDENSYYVVTVKVNGNGCDGQDLTYKASNGVKSKDGDSNITNGGIYTFRVYPISPCDKSTATATLTNTESSTVSIGIILHDWKTETGCWPKEEYEGKAHSFEEADKNGYNHYYTNLGTCEDGTTGYTTHAYRNGCDPSGGGTTPSTENDACYMNNATGIYVWGKYKNDSNYTLIADKTSKDTCKPSPEGGEGEEVYACYKDANNNYKWATTAPEGYTLVESIKEEANCKVVDKAACYIDANNKYVWGDYSNNASYKLVESIKTAENCVNPPACYKDKDGNFVWGNYAYNSSYSLIANITSQSDCGESVKVPSTAASTATIIYISVIVMLIAGGSVVYYVYNKKKFS